MSLYSGNCIELKPIEGTSFVELSVNLKNESVNKFNAETLKELGEALKLLPPSLKGLLVSSGKDSFLAGADITEFLAHFKRPESELKTWIGEIQKLFSTIEDLNAPTVCNIQGFALGGGFEFALSCDFRIASTGTKLGLPETKLGIIPGWGGTVRLPRVIGLDSALEWITSGNQYDAETALKYGAIHAVVAPQELRNAGLDLLNRASKGEIEWRALKEEKKAILPLNPTESMMAFSINKAGVFAVAGSNYPAPLKAIDVIEKAAHSTRETALQFEAEGFASVAKTVAAQALVGTFLADQAVKKKAKGTKSLAQPVSQAAVLGAGIMGGGIAYQSAISRVPMIMKDIKTEALHHGLKEAASLLDKQIQRGKSTPLQMADSLGRITPTLKMDDLKAAQVIIEAVTENEKVKISVLQEVENTVTEKTVITSNTSTISITRLAESLKHPEQFCGMHFFNPVPKMPLVEIIRGAKTSPETIATVVQYALTLGKTPIVVNDCPGFLVNRVLFAYLTAFNGLVAEGVDFVKIDKVMEKWGWPMGPSYLSDVVGIDTANHAFEVMAKGFPNRIKFEAGSPLTVLYKATRYGQKNGKGFYQYSVDAKGKSKKEVSPETYALLGQDPKSASFLERNAKITDAEIIDRLMIPFIFESARCLEEKIVDEAYELDLAMLLGVGFPPFRGGPARYADAIGTSVLLEKATVLEKKYGELYQAPTRIKNKENFYV